MSASSSPSAAAKRRRRRRAALRLAVALAAGVAAGLTVPRGEIETPEAPSRAVALAAGEHFVEARSMVTWTVARETRLGELLERSGLGLSPEAVVRLNPKLFAGRAPSADLVLPAGTRLRLFIQTER